MAEQMHERVEVGDAKSVRALVQMGSGQLAVKGGAGALMEGRFEFSNAAWRPEVTYDVSHDAPDAARDSSYGMGNLVVKQPERTKSTVTANANYVWDLALGNEVPVELAVRLASGDADLRLADTRAVLLEAAIGSGRVRADLARATELRHVAVKVGSGRVDLMFAGEYTHLSKVEVSVASGQTDLVLDGEYASLKELRINAASGRIGLRIAGACPALKTLALNTASGFVDLDIAGSLPADLAVGIRCVSGVSTVKLPAGLGASLRFSSVSGKLTTPGFRKENGRYVNAAYRAGAGALHLVVSTVSGELILQPIEL